MTIQVKKEEVKERIYIAALEEFKINGYKNTTIRNISKSANVPIGNLYRYYKNKDLLFSDIVDKVYLQLLKILTTPDTIEELDDYMGLSIISKRLTVIADMHANYKDEILILFNGSQGSKYDNFNAMLIEGLSNRMKNEWQYFVNKGEVLPRDLFIFEVIASGLIDGIRIILNRYDDHEELIKALKEFLQFTSGDFINRLKSATN
ncbi:TetR/AcrR family transcriptional regulator [Vallitalea okinawensis]|uniref:TetR/AcrR family transcriptional regulator n=1 Tax=Vallitalea okinawensis TaxID=2078660 RepID=UPI000CFB599A|nr:TetR/AcrR family transcriptional regulator [Vallitalea okinawensis]